MAWLAMVGFPRGAQPCRGQYFEPRPSWCLRAGPARLQLASWRPPKRPIIQVNAPTARAFPVLCVHTKAAPKPGLLRREYSHSVATALGAPYAAAVVPAHRGGDRAAMLPMPRTNPNAGGPDAD